jgi:hypothetical protein
MNKSLHHYLKDFSNTEEYNDSIFEEFTAKANEIDFLKKHRDFIEKNALGFGDRAFHYLWYLLIENLLEKKVKLSFLEIGVYKGQVISLWSLIVQHFNQSEFNITGITPLEGKPKPKLSLYNKVLLNLSKKFREDVENGNFYEEADYYQIISSIYKEFQIDISNTKIIKGYSTDPVIIAEAKQKDYSLIYIDGDHSYDGALSDIKNFSSQLMAGGYLVIDDASCYIPGTKFWKGHKAVSDACEKLPEYGFKNVLNVGHNRIYQKNIN